MTDSACGRWTRASKASAEARPEEKEENRAAELSNFEEQSLPTNNDSDEETSDLGKRLGEISGEV